MGSFPWDMQGKEPKAFQLPTLHPSQGSTEIKGFMEASRDLSNPQGPTEVDSGVPSEALLITMSPQLAPRSIKEFYCNYESLILFHVRYKSLMGPPPPLSLQANDAVLMRQHECFPTAQKPANLART